MEDVAFIDMLMEAIPEGEVSTVQLSAKQNTLEARLRGSEVGSGLDWHINRAGQIVASLAAERTPVGHRIDADGRTVLAIAEEIVSKYSGA